MRPSHVRWARKASTGVRKPKPSSKLLQTGSWFDHVFSYRSDDSRRRDIVNQGLCHDVLSLIQPSLPAPSSCDIIDINPGPGVWSAALHKALAPRRHVLLGLEEPAPSSPLGTLLSKEDSAYRYSSSFSNVWDEKLDLLSPHLRSSYTNLSPSERVELTRHHNSQLIVTANLGGKHLTLDGFRGSRAKFFVAQLYRNLAQNGLFPFTKYGLVKFLIWVPELDKYSLLPRGAGMRHIQSKHLEASCHIREIVGSFPNDQKAPRHWPWHGASVESMHQIAAKQQDSSIVIPPHRSQPEPGPPSFFHDPAPENLTKLMEVKRKSRLVSEYIKAYKIHQRSYPAWTAESDQDMNNTSRPKPLHTRELPAEALAEQQRFRSLRRRMRTTYNNYAKVDSLARRQVELEHYLINLRRENCDDKELYKNAISQTQDEFDSIKAHYLSFFKDNRHHFIKAVDDYRTLLPAPGVNGNKVLSWNNRTFEPLLSHPEQDFHPSFPMSLLEITPKASFVQTLNTTSRKLCYNHVTNELSSTKTMTVEEALENLLGESHDQDLYKDFVASVPSLTDPLYGGFHDLSAVRCRTLRVETIMDVALAYTDWPYRRPASQLLQGYAGALGLEFASGEPVTPP